MVVAKFPSKIFVFTHHGCCKMLSFLTSWFSNYRVNVPLLFWWSRTPMGQFSEPFSQVQSGLHSTWFRSHFKFSNAERANTFMEPGRVFSSPADLGGTSTRGPATTRWCSSEHPFPPKSSTQNLWNLTKICGTWPKSVAKTRNFPLFFSAWNRFVRLLSFLNPTFTFRKMV